MTDLKKLYSGLTDAERAGLVFSYQSKNDDLEVARIQSTMPEQTFVGLPMAFRRCFGGLRDAAMFYALEYWRLVAHCQALAAGAVAILHASNDIEQGQHIIDQFKTMESRLLSLDAALDEFCRERGLDAGALRTMAGDRFYQCTHDDLVPDEDFQNALRGFFNNLLT